MLSNSFVRNGFRKSVGGLGGEAKKEGFLATREKTKEKEKQKLLVPCSCPHAPVHR